MHIQHLHLTLAAAILLNIRDHQIKSLFCQFLEQKKQPLHYILNGAHYHLLFACLMYTFVLLIIMRKLFTNVYPCFHKVTLYYSKL